MSENVIFEIVLTYFYPKPYTNTASLIEHGEMSENVFFEIVATYFYPKPYTNTASLAECGGNIPKCIFRDSCHVLLPAAVYTYGKFGRIRGKYPKNYLLERTEDS